MTTEQILASVKTAVGQGELKNALTEMLAFLDGDVQFSDLADAARINRSEFEQTREQVLKGTISVADARQSNNLVADRLLELVAMVERGEFQFPEKTVGGEVARKLRWQYFVIGGLVALAAAYGIYRFWVSKADTCPDWGRGEGYNVMILPFKHLGKDDSKTQPEIILMDNLTALSEKHGLRARFDVNEGFDTEANYPSPATALEIGQTCNAQMVVWGKINQKTADSYTIDVKYKLLDAGAVKQSGDTSITRILTSATDGGWTQDAENVSKFLFIVLANRLQRSDVVVDEMKTWLSESSEKIRTTLPSDSAAVTKADTSLNLQMGYSFYQAGDYQKAAAQFDKVLAASPSSVSTLKVRGASRFLAGDYEGAALDFEVARAVSKEKPSAAMLKMAAEANLRTNRLANAKRDLDDFQKTPAVKSEEKWTARKRKEIEEKTSIAVVEAVQSEKVAEKRPTDAKANLRAARKNLNVGKSSKSEPICR